MKLDQSRYRLQEHREERRRPQGLAQVLQRNRATLSLAVVLGLRSGLAFGANTLVVSVDPGVSYGYYTMVNGVAYAVPGETWTFDHGAPDPLEGWRVEIPENGFLWSLPRLSDFATHDPNLPPTPGLSGLGYGGQRFLWLGMHEDRADSSCWSYGTGYGYVHHLQRATSPVLTRTPGLPGNTQLSLPVIWDVCPYINQEDTVQVRVRVGETETTVWTGAGGSQLNGENVVSLNLDPALGTATTFQILFAFSGRGEGDTYSYDSSFGAARADNIAITGDGLHEFWSFDGGPEKSPSVSFAGPQTDCRFGTSVAAADVNGDGYQDLVVGAEAYTNGQVQEGAVFVYLAAANGSFTLHRTLELNNAFASFGYRVAGADLDGDGYDEVIVGAPTYSAPGVNQGGAVAIFHGGPGGLGSTPWWQVNSVQDFSSYGAAIANAGDVNGDGFDELLVGEPMWDQTLVNRGRALLYFGSAFGPGSTPSWTFLGTQANSDLGRGLAGGEEYTGDGRSDFAVAAPQESQGGNLGVVRIFAGSPSGGGVYTTIVNSGSSGTFGRAMAFSHNQGKTATFVIGDPAFPAGGSTGVIRCYSPDGSGFITAALDPAIPGDFGRSLSGGDVNGDGVGDIVVGSPFDLGGGGGRAFVLTGGVGGFSHGDHPTWIGGRWENPGAVDYGAAVCVLQRASSLPTVVVSAPGFDETTGHVESFPCHAPSSEGWTFTNRTTPDFVGVADQNDYVLPGGCSLSGNVLEMHDDSGHHPIGQSISLISPLIPLPEPGVPQVWLTANMFGKLPWQGRGLYRWRAEGRKPCLGTTVPHWDDYDPSGWQFWPDPSCASIEESYSGACAQPIDALRVRFDFVYDEQDWCPCDDQSNISPLLDDIRIGRSKPNPRSLTFKAYYDVNGNGHWDNESFAPGARYDIAPEGVVALNPEGEGWVLVTDLDPVVHTVEITPPPGWQMTNPANGTLVIDSTPPCPQTEYYIGMQPLSGVRDLQLIASANAKWKPTVEGSVKLKVVNLGSVAEQATVEAQVPNEFTVTSTAPTAVPLGNGVWQFNLGTISVGASAEAKITGSVGVQTPVGTQLTFSGTVTPPPGDITPDNDQASTTLVVVGALDPNEMVVSPEGPITTSDRLTYQIDFQNIGTAAADSVIVRDELDADLDLSTLELEATSHAGQITLAGHSILWRLDAINLPPVSEDEAGSHGWVRFSVKPKSALTPGTQITNNASIQFDNLDPLVTNTVTNWILSPAGTPDLPIAATAFRVGSPMPNPMGDRMELAVNLPSAGELELSIVDASGRRVYARANALPAGDYRLEWNRCTDAGAPVPRGVYFANVRFASGKDEVKQERRKLVLVE